MKHIKKPFITFLLVISMLNSINLNAHAKGTAPVAENLEISTLRDKTVEGVLSALDPEGDVAQFIVTTDPIKGEINLEADGTFKYTPREGKKGRDYFGYKAVDSEGNVSQEATVIIKIIKP